MKKINKHIEKLTLDFLSNSSVDAINLSIIDFNNKSFESSLFESKLSENCSSKIFFDLASLSKPLINGIGFLAEEKNITDEMKLVLNHRGGIPSWGILSRDSWQYDILNYQICESPTLYSDYSALRFMLEFNNLKLGSSLHSTASKYWDEDIFFWKNLKSDHRTLQNGFIKGEPNFRAVHDPNAYNLNQDVSHAGLFGTADSISKTLLGLDKEFELLKKMKEGLSESKHRFINGWDRVENPDTSLAGNGCSLRTFGHLGFTGTSVWIDCDKGVGYILLSNATKLFWYNKADFNIYRKQLGTFIWKDSF